MINVEKDMFRTVALPAASGCSVELLQFSETKFKITVICFQLSNFAFFLSVALYFKKNTKKLLKNFEYSKSQENYKTFGAEGRIRDRSLFIGITGSGKFSWNFSRFSWPVHTTFKKFKARTSYHNFFQNPSGTNTDFFP